LRIRVRVQEPYIDDRIVGHYAQFVSGRDSTSAVARRRESLTHAPGPPSFALHSLGWRAFQDLAAVVLRDVMGQSFQSFADSRDSGRDGAFYGRWRRRRSAGSYADLVPEGPVVLQCKHTSRSDATLTISVLGDEITKAGRLVARGLCTSYILLTNARVTGESEGRIRAALQDAGVAYPLVLGASWINQTIASERGLRVFVPRVYGLGDLSQILDERAYAQAEALLQYLRTELSTFVVTDAYRRAAEAIQRHGFVLLLGEPGAGKSVIAATLAMTSIDAWGCTPIRAHTAEELVSHWNPDEPGQFFWVDDAFGPVRHDWGLTQSWSLRLPSVMTAVESGARIVLTSRDYIYREARRYLKEYAFPRLRESQVVVDVTELTRSECERILYNHVRLGNQSRSFRTALKAHLDSAAGARPFRPEAARRLGQKAFTEGLALSGRSVVEFVENPRKYLGEVVEQLDQDQRAALALVFVSGQLRPPIGEDARQAELLRRLGSTPAAAGTALESLDGTFVRFGAAPGSGEPPGWSFHHPTLREGFAAFVAAHPNLIDVFVAGLSADGILTQIDCGSGQAGGTLVSIPPHLYSEVADRLARMHRSEHDWERRWAWHQFFVQRCSPDFLRVYQERDPDFVERLLGFGSYLSIAPEPRVLARLRETGLLQESHRRTAIARASELAIETPDADWLDAPEWAVIASDGERREILERVRSDLIPSLRDDIDNWRMNRDSDQDPDDYFRPLEETLERYAAALSGDSAVVAELRAAIDEVNQLRHEANNDYQPPAARPFSLRSPVPNSTGGDRSTFDDVDG
jgi:hypothetical protein